MNRGILVRGLFVVCFVLAGGYGCGGGCGGCSSMEPIPGGFPAAKRHDNAGQIRVARTALDQIEANPAALVGNLLGTGGGPLSFPVPGSCGGNPAVCCANNAPVPNCGPIDIDLVKQPGDDARLVLAPKPSGNVNGELDVTVRARVKTEMDLPVNAFGLTCGIKIDSTVGAHKDLEIVVPVNLNQDGTAGTTRIAAGTVAINRLDNEDVAITGNIACQLANFGTSFLLGTLKSTIANQIASSLNGATCKACASGDVGECASPFAATCDSNVCKESNGDCVQELGLTGRLLGGSLFAGFSPGTTGALDLYEIIGGYATTNNNGVALGMLGGMEPAGAPRDRCGPSATEPATAAIPESVFFQGNTRPDTGAPFDVAIGIHKSQLAQFAFAGYDGGLLCLTVGKNVSAMLTTDTIGLLSRSLTHLVDTAEPVAIGLRPQSPPDIVLGKNTFTTDGSGNTTLTEPLLDITFHQMEIDFFAAVDDQYIRIFTVVADVHLPIGLQVTAAGQIQPVLGNTDQAFTNLSVKNSDAVTESPADLANLFPNLLGLVLPQLSSALPAISLPAISGLNLTVDAITAVPTTATGTSNDFLAIFAKLAVATPLAPIETRAEVVAVDAPDAAVLASPRTWSAHRAPQVTLALAADRLAHPGAAVEYSVRVDHGTWSAWSTNAHPTLSTGVFWLQGEHAIEVRARERGVPETIDDSPVALTVPIGTPTTYGGNVPNPFHGQAGASGCGCQSSATPGGALLAALVLGFVVMPRRRRRKPARRGLGRIVWLAAVACLPGCSCSSSPCGSASCVAGDVEHGALGKWTAIAGDDQRVLVSTYDKGLGDLVVVDATDPANLVLTAVDGYQAAGATPTHDPKGYRGGIEDPGPDVGAHSSIAMAGGFARVAYQDRDNKALKFAYEGKGNAWSSYTLDAGHGEEVGAMTAMTTDANGFPIVAYLAVGKDDGTGHRVSELRVAHASASVPGEGDWTTSVVASAPGTCAGLCDAGTACVTGSDGLEACVAPSNDCAAACGSAQACVAGACVATIPDPTVGDLPTGTGLFPNVMVMGDGRLALVYYNRTDRALVAAMESAAGSGQFAETTLDVATPGDRGMWCDAVLEPSSGKIHVAYQEALGDQLFYTTFDGTTVGPIEVVDDGERTGDRPHPVGAAASIYLANGSPVVAYQDGLVSDVDLATRGGSGWTVTPLASGPLLDGFSIATTTAHAGTPYLAWEQFVPANAPPGGLIVQTH